MWMRTFERICLSLSSSEVPRVSKLLWQLQLHPRQ
jgi:hypothetical protein